jgi:hypothetical protein
MGKFKVGDKVVSNHWLYQGVCEVTDIDDCLRGWFIAKDCDGNLHDLLEALFELVKDGSNAE